jgi:cell division septation protein DedD
MYCAKTMPTAAFSPFVSHAVPAATPHRRTRFASSALALALSASVLSGCAIWPDALTFGSKEPKTMEEPVTPMPPSACVVECEKKMLATQAKPAEPVSSEPQALAPQVVEPPAPPMMEAPKPVVLAPGYYINVGAFAMAENGSNAYQKLKAAGLPAFTEILDTNGNKLTRVRVGAYVTRANANAAAKKIRSLKLEAVVFVKK